MSEPTTASEAIQQAEAMLAELQSMNPLVSIRDSVAKANCRMDIMALTGAVLNGHLPPQSQAERDRAAQLYSLASEIR